MTALLTPNFLYLRHHLLIGIGEWGKETIRAAGLALQQSHPEMLPVIELAHASSEGLGHMNWQPATLINSEDSRSFFPVPRLPDPLPKGYPQDLSGYVPFINTILREAVSLTKAAQLRRLGHRPVEGSQPMLDIHILGQLEDPLTQNLLLPLIDLLSKHHPASLRYRLYLYLSCDSTSWAALDQKKKSEISTFANRLNKLLAQQTNRKTGGDGDLAICYLVDTVNEDSRALAAPTGGDRHSAQGQLTAGMLALLFCSEILNTEAHETCLARPLVKQNRLSSTSGYVSTFSLNSLVYPVFEARRLFLLSSARQILELFAPEQSLHLEEETGTTEQFFTGLKLDRVSMNEWIGRDESSGQPYHFTFDPLLLDDVPEDALVDVILSWDGSMGRSRVQAAVNAMHCKRESRLQDARIWVSSHIDRLMTHPEGNTGTALQLCASLKERIEKEAAREFARPVKQRAGWLRFLFAPLARSQDEVLDTAPLTRKLQEALGSRVVRLAVWERLAVQAGVEGLFLMLAWPTIWPGLQKAYPFLPAAPLASAIGLAMVLFIVMVNALVAFSIICASEYRIQKGHNRLVKAIQDRYSAILQNELRKTLSVFYASLRAFIEDESALVNRWVDLSKNTSQKLIEQSMEQSNETVPYFEEYLLSTQELFEQVPPLHPNELDGLYAAFSEEPAVQGWRQVEPEPFLRNLLSFVESQLGKRLDGLSIEHSIEQCQGEPALQERVADLQNRSRLQLAMAGINSAPQMAFLAVDDRKLSRVMEGFQTHFQTNPASTGDSSRITYLVTAHGIPMKKIKIWEDLEQ